MLLPDGRHWLFVDFWPMPSPYVWLAPGLTSAILHSSSWGCDWWDTPQAWFLVTVPSPLSAPPIGKRQRCLSSPFSFFQLLSTSFNFFPLLSTSCCNSTGSRVSALSTWNSASFTVVVQLQLLPLPLYHSCLQQRIEKRKKENR